VIKYPSASPSLPEGIVSCCMAARPLAQGCKLRHGFCAADSRALLVAEIFDLPLDQVKRKSMRRTASCAVLGLFALRVGQALKRLEKPSPRMSETPNVQQAGALTHARKPDSHRFADSRCNPR